MHAEMEQQEAKFVKIVHKMALLSFVLSWWILILCQNASSTVNSTNFCYDVNDRSCGPYDWPGACQTARYKSPINIPLTSSHMASAVKKQLLISQSYLEFHSFTLTNTGQTARLEVASHERGQMTVGGALLNNNNYTFAHVDFHWGPSDDDGSEHSVNGKRYAMEAQLVHHRSDFDNVSHALASKDPHALTIFAIFFEITRHFDYRMANVTGALKEIKKVGKSARISYFTLQYILFDQFDPVIMQYDGSLTTPDCNESVLWNVFSDIASISPCQLQGFWSMNDYRGDILGLWRNNRDVASTTAKIQYFRSTVRENFQ